MKLLTIASCLVSMGLVRASYIGSQIPLLANDKIALDVSSNSDDVTLNKSFGKLIDFEVNGLSLLHLHRNLVSIPSVSQNEFAVAEYLVKVLEDAGLTVELLKVPSAKADGAPRYDVYAYPGSTRDTKVVITSHIDTVPPYIPYSVHGSKIYGRGSCDAKGSVATQVLAVLSLLDTEDVKEGEVSLLFVVGEEADGSGMQQASKQLGATWGSAIFGEPTELKLGVGHKGVYYVDIQVKGKASHSGYPELGISASEILIPVLNDLLNLKTPKSDLLGPTTLNIGKVAIGVAANVVPAEASATAFFRVAQDIEVLEGLVQGVLDRVEHLTYEVRAKSSPQYIDYEVPGFELIILAYATDIPNLFGQNLTSRYLYGPGSIHVAHGDNEFVENADLIEAIHGYQKLIKYVLE